MKNNKLKSVNAIMIIFIIMNFVTSMSSTLFNSILDQIAVNINIPLSQTGYLTSFYSYGAGIGVPIFLVLLRRVDRSLLLKWTLFANIIVTSASLIAPNYPVLLIMRFFMGLTGNCYAVLATANIAAISPKEKVGKNISLLITGSASALMIGIPLTRRLSALYSWKAIFVVLVILMILSLIYFILFLPSVKQVQHFNLKEELLLLKKKRVTSVLLGSMVTFLGYGAFYTYLTPYLIELFPQVESIMSLILFGIGFSSFSGNLLGGIVCDRMGFVKALKIGTLAQVFISLGILFTKEIMLLNLILIFIWMMNGWFIGLQLNTGITVVTQSKSNLMISLNSSCIQLGQAIGVSVTSIILSYLSISMNALIPAVTSVLVIMIVMTMHKENVR